MSCVAVILAINAVRLDMASMSPVPWEIGLFFPAEHLPQTCSQGYFARSVSGTDQYRRREKADLAFTNPRCQICECTHERRSDRCCVRKAPVICDFNAVSGISTI